MANKIEVILNVLGDYIDHIEQSLNAYQEAYRKAIEENNALKEQLEKEKKNGNAVLDNTKKAK